MLRLSRKREETLQNSEPIEFGLPPTRTLILVPFRRDTPRARRVPPLVQIACTCRVRVARRWAVLPKYQ